MVTSGESGSAAQSEPGPEQLDAAWQAVLGSIAAARRDTGESAGGGIGATLLTGFLGSGKTTVLRHLLADPAGLRIAAVVNDIGSINVDAISIGAFSLSDQGAAGPGSVGGVGDLDGSGDAGGVGDSGSAGGSGSDCGAAAAVSADRRIELTNGCACCALVDDLADSLEGLADAGVFDAIVVEASGAADPAMMALAVESASGCRLDGVVAVVDAQHLAAQLVAAQIGSAVRRQIDVAHLVVLSKVDLVDDAQVQALTARIAEIAPGRMVVPSAHGRIDPRVLLSAAMRGAAFDPVTHGHPIEIAKATVLGIGPWEPAAVGRWFDEQPEPLLRAKGWFASPGGRWHELQVVGRRWSIEPAGSPAETGPPPAVVLIGRDQPAVDRAAAALSDLDGSGCASTASRH